MKIQPTKILAAVYRRMRPPPGPVNEAAQRLLRELAGATTVTPKIRVAMAELGQALEGERAKEVR